MAAAGRVAHIIFGAGVSVDAFLFRAAFADSIDACVIFCAHGAVKTRIAVELYVFARPLWPAEIALVECARISILAQVFVDLEVSIVIDPVAHFSCVLGDADEDRVAARCLVADEFGVFAAARAVF